MRLCAMALDIQLADSNAVDPTSMTLQHKCAAMDPGEIYIFLFMRIEMTRLSVY